MRRRVQPKFWIIVIAVMITAFATSFALAQHNLRQGAQELADAISQRQALQSEVDQLRASLDFAQTDEYVIRVARDELGMIMPGEIRYVSGN